MLQSSCLINSEFCHILLKIIAMHLFEHSLNIQTFTVNNHSKKPSCFKESVSSKLIEDESMTIIYETNSCNLNIFDRKIVFYYMHGVCIRTACIYIIFICHFTKVIINVHLLLFQNCGERCSKLCGT